MHPFYDEEELAGGIPDPKDRTWRHPSEVAAEEAATETIADYAPRYTPAQRQNDTRQTHLMRAVLAAALCTGGLIFGGFLSAPNDYSGPNLFNQHDDLLARFVGVNVRAFTSTCALSGLDTALLSFEG